jgi:hypothetical protein
MYQLYRYLKRRKAAKVAAETGVPAPSTKPKSKLQLCEHRRPLVNTTSGFSSDPSITVPNESKGAITHDPTQSIPIQNESELQPQDTLVSTIAEEGEKPCTICREQKLAARKYRWKLMGGLFLPFTLQALDGTIIASALPFMASDFRKTHSHALSFSSIGMELSSLN